VINLVETGQCFRAPEKDWYTKTDWNAVRAELLRFTELRDPIAHAPGMQILRQPFVECVVSFILSANNNIKRFSKTLAQMQFDLDWLCGRTEDDFRAMGCGYRAPYLVSACKRLCGMDYAELCKLDDAALYKELRTVKGVGDKVARCLQLFCFHRLNVVPVDTWIEKAYRQLTGDEAKRSVRYIADWYQNRYGQYAGVAQQYLFYYLQYLKKELT